MMLGSFESARVEKATRLVASSLAGLPRPPFGPLLHLAQAVDPDTRLLSEKRGVALARFQQKLASVESMASPHHVTAECQPNRKRDPALFQHNSVCA